ncbi:NAD(P)H-binding protein [Cellulomonas carbonis]|uniref:Nucleoside-diphosphate sugar epimerase n=1 Tax=Cellulomonas carbonis T26 TaxID=947969 RepID=A0A0A0BXB6_9CELL|nr:NmrA family NAD(P)-binding protein [Cellulomonas carbonis]KGM12610.1 nucleoside-diphosphate sugar epimerase [Cellulomonas carbonis T26]GGC05932.1 NAD(P)-dependent oxidoreductase [Cellulomonas carbonis]
MIVVTGATGPFGRTVVESLIARGVAASDIRAGGRDPERLAALEDLGVDAVELDYDRPETVQAAVQGADQVLLVSGSEVGRRVPQHRAVLEAAAAAGVAHVAYTSVLHADTTTLAVAPDHRATEDAVRELGLTATLLRNGWYSENYLATLDQARATGEVVTAAGDGRVASAARADYAEAAAAVLADPALQGRTYELSGDVAWSFADLAATVGDVLGREVALRSVEPDEYRANLTAGGLDAGLVEFLVGMDVSIRDGELADTTGDLSRLLGRPTTPLTDALRDATSAG